MIIAKKSASMVNVDSTRMQMKALSAGVIVLLIIFKSYSRLLACAQGICYRIHATVL